MSPGTGSPIAKATDKTCETLSPTSHQPLPTILLSLTLPTSGDVGVGKVKGQEGVYDNIPRDMTYNNYMSQ